MDKLSQKRFDRLIRVAPDQLTPSECAFLSARYGYMSPREQDIYANVMEAGRKEHRGQLHKDEKEVSFKELKSRAKTIGVPVPFGINKKKLQKDVAVAEEKTRRNPFEVNPLEKKDQESQPKKNTEKNSRRKK
jgi:hypothetical protein